MVDLNAEKTENPNILHSLCALGALLLHFFGALLSLCIPRSRRIFLFIGGAKSEQIAEIADLFAGFASSEGGPARVFAVCADTKIAKSVGRLRACWLTLRARQMFVANSIGDGNRYLMYRAAVTVLFADDEINSSILRACDSKCRLIAGRARFELRRIAQFVVSSEEKANTLRRLLSLVPGRVRVIEELSSNPSGDSIKPDDLNLTAVCLESRFLAESQEKLIPELKSVSGPIPDLFALAVENIYPLRELVTAGVYIASRNFDVEAAAFATLILRYQPEAMVYWSVDTESAKIPSGTKPVLRGSRRALAAQKSAKLAILERHNRKFRSKKQILVRLLGADVYFDGAELSNTSAVSELIDELRADAELGNVFLTSAKHRLGVPQDKRVLLCEVGACSPKLLSEYVAQQNDSWVVSDVPIDGIGMQSLMVSYEDMWDALLVADETIVFDQRQATSLSKGAKKVVLLNGDAHARNSESDHISMQIRSKIKDFLSIQ